MPALTFDEEHLTLGHDFLRWLWWEPGDTPRGGDPDASKRTRVLWRDVVRLDATGPYPELIVAYHTADDVRKVTARPRSGDLGPWIESVEALFEAARSHLEPSALRPGWAAAELVGWEPFEEWPDEERVAILASPYRGAPPGEQVRAVREAPPPLEALLQWLASTPEYPWKEHPVRVMATDRHVCVRRRSGEQVRVERRHLRGRRRTPHGDRAYYYGRELRLLLPLRDDACPVIWALDADYRAIVGGG